MSRNVCSLSLLLSLSLSLKAKSTFKDLRQSLEHFLIKSQWNVTEKDVFLLSILTSTFFRIQVNIRTAFYEKLNDSDFFIFFFCMIFRRGFPQLPPHVSLWLFNKWVWPQTQLHYLFHWRDALIGPCKGMQAGIQGGSHGSHPAHWERQS